MAIIKCKMCGGDMEISADKTFGVCEYCGSTMTLPKVDSEQRAAIFNRGNHFRRICEFDKALAVYERIVAEDDTDAEAHWCCALCRFGIEYVEDPATMEWLPTCHRASFDSFLEDVDYLAAVEHSDGMTRRQYQKDAAKIAEVQRGILATSQTADPFDVFICYKETDEQGQRTRDSMLAQDIYYQLTEEGYRVFFSRITLEDVAGTQYEPYIFGALNSAKVMVAVGTKAEHLNAVWVKNEWSRFLALMKKDRSKLLLPCYRDMDPYDLPEQLGVLQSYDMSKIGFVQDLIRGISKVLDAGKKEPEPVHTETVVTQMTGNNVVALLERGQMAIEDMEWQKADEFFEEALNQDAKNAVAYLGKYLVSKESTSLHSIASFYLKHTESEEMEKKVFCGQQKEREQELVQTYAIPNYLPESKLSAMLELQFVYKSGVAHRQAQLKHAEQWLEDRLLVRARQYADVGMKAKLDAFSQQVLGEMKARVTQAEEAEKINLQKVERQYRDVLSKCEQEMKRLHQQAREKREADYQAAVEALNEAKSAADFQQAERALKSLNSYKDSDALSVRCREKAAQIQSKRSQVMLCVGIVAACIFALIILFNNVIIPNHTYRAAEKMLAAGDLEQAAGLFESLGDYRDAADRVKDSIYAEAERLLAAGDMMQAVEIFESLGDYKDAPDRAKEPIYAEAENLLADGETAQAAMMFDTIGDWKDADQRSRLLWDSVAVRGAIAAGENHTVGLESNGTVMAVGRNKEGQCKVSGWRNVLAVTAGDYHTVGLKSDGTVVAVGSNKFAYEVTNQCNVSSWTDIVAVTAGDYHTVGLKTDGTVVAVGQNWGGQCNVSDWMDIVAVAAGAKHTVGLKLDGTVVAEGNDKFGPCEVTDWSDIVAVAAYAHQTIGLKSDGTVVAAGSNEYGQCNVSKWRDIVAVAAGGYHTVGLKSNGTVVAVGYNEYGQCNVSKWRDIVAVAAGRYHTVGLKSDGTVVAVGANIDFSGETGQLNVLSWDGIKQPNQ